MNSSAASDHNEPEWIRRSRQGDGTAWEALMLLHQEAVFRLAYLLTGDEHEAQDVAQETFMRAYNALGRFDEERPMRPWLLRIAANQAHNRSRSLGRYIKFLQRFGERPFSGENGHIERLAEQNLSAKALWEAVRRLAFSDQEIIYLRFFLELSVSETAESLNVAPGTVKSRLHRALQHLRSVIEADFPLLLDSVPYE